MSALVEQILREILIEDLELSPEELRSDADLVADLGFDSLSFATGVAEIRERLGVTLTKDAVFGCRTLGELQSLVAGQLAAA